MSKSKKTYHLINDFHLLAYESVDSTNEEARRLAEGGASHGAVIWARQQSQGRGRLGRDWVSREGNLFVSILLSPECPLEHMTQLSFLSAVAAVEALEPLVATGEGKLTCKWPNDILLDGRKLGGILLESFTTKPGADRSTRAQWVVVGMGVNVDSYPSETRYPATCLKEAGLELVSAKIVLTRFIEAFMARYDEWVKSGFAPIRKSWLAHAHGLNGEVQVSSGIANANDDVQGIFEGISDTGEMLVKLADGKTQPIHSGDVTFIAPKKPVKRTKKK